MQLREKMFNYKKIEELLIKENQFIKQLFSTASLPTRNDETIDGDTQEDQNNDKIIKIKETTRAKSLSELQQRLEAITSKKKLTYKEKLTKKSLKNRIKKKNKRDERNAAKKLIRAQELSDKNNDNDATTSTTKSGGAKPVFNSEGKLVFSKFDFSNLGQDNDHKKTKKKHENDPKKLLKNLEKQKEKLTELEESGEIGKVVEIKEQSAWKSALAKAEGQKVKDDPILLKKTVQRLEQKKRSSRKKWETRQQNVEKQKDERQRKRQENIDKRKKDKKTHKLKRAAKKGRIIPGF